ncbi:MAG: alpha/beta hydrolase [Gammaproteobacteria bacterium]|nr:MAG: alpha/beta hydrolase [Gammaproteobacteria bacterium]
MEWLLPTIISLLVALYLPYLFKTFRLKKINVSHVPEEGDWANLSDGNIFYRWFLPDKEHSNGETIVLVHGFSTPSFVWGGLINTFCNSGFKVLAYDHFGRGFSERPRINYDKELYIRSLKELMDDQDIKGKVHLVGYSMGGPIVGYFAEKYPNQTKSMSLIAPAGFQQAMAGVNSWTIKPIVGEWFWHVFNNRIYGVGRMSETAYSDDPLSINEEEFLENFNKQLVFKGFTESLLSTVRHFNLMDCRRMYKNVGYLDIPTFVVWGKNDGVVPHSSSTNLKECIPHSELLTIEEGTHDITYRQPTEVGDSINSFLLNKT